MSKSYTSKRSRQKLTAFHDRILPCQVAFYSLAGDRYVGVQCLMFSVLRAPNCHSEQKQTRQTGEHSIGSQADLGTDRAGSEGWRIRSVTAAVKMRARGTCNENLKNVQP